MRYSGNMGYMAVLFVAAVVTLGWYSEAETPPAALDIAVTDVYDAIETPLRFTVCYVDCYRPHTCYAPPGACAHKAPNVGHGSHDANLGSHTSCWPGHCEWSMGPNCMGQHPLCVRGGAWDASLAALEGTDFAKLSAIMDIGAGIEVLWEPGLLAFYDCADRVIASVALTGVEVAALAVAEGQLQ